MCSSSSPAPQPTSTTQTTIPEYAQPYAEKMLGKAEAITESPYQTYGGQRMAAATPEQQAARQDVAGMQQPGQFAAGTGLAAAGGLGALGAGQQYMQMATDPGAQQAFMSPICRTWLTCKSKKQFVMPRKGSWLRTWARLVRVRMEVHVNFLLVLNVSVTYNKIWQTFRLRGLKRLTKTLCAVCSLALTAGYTRRSSRHPSRGYVGSVGYWSATGRY
jgi:hypothetical protein